MHAYWAHLRDYAKLNDQVLNHLKEIRTKLFVISEEQPEMKTTVEWLLEKNIRPAISLSRKAASIIAKKITEDKTPS